MKRYQIYKQIYRSSCKIEVKSINSKSIEAHHWWRWKSKSMAENAAIPIKMLKLQKMVVFFWDLRRKHLTWLMLRVWLSMTSKCGFRLFTILFWLVWTFDNPASNGAPPIAQSYESRYVFFSSQRLTRKEKASGMANGLSREGWQRKKMFKPLRILWLSDKISW